jgi:hypothetical protein
MENTIVSNKLSRTVKSNDKRPFYKWERTPKFIYSSTTEGQNSPPQSTVSPSTSFSSLDSGFIHGCSTPPPTAEEEVSNGIDDRLNGSNAQTTQQYPETSTPVLTRSSILRTSSQRLDAWNISPKHKPVDRKDSVRFKLSLPRRIDDVPYSDSDSDSNSGSYTINTNVPKENIKRKRKSKELDQDSDWQPLIMKLKDNKHSVRQKIKPGYVSQMKKIFSSQEDLRIDDFNTSSRKTNLKRHNSANDISNRYLSVVKTTVNPPQRTHSLNKISDRTDVKVLKEEYSDNRCIDHSVPKPTNIFNDKSNMHSQALNNLTKSSTNKPGSHQSFSNITRNQTSSKPVTSKKGKLFPDRTETQNSDNTEFRQTGSQRVSCSTEVSDDICIRSRGMRTNGLREFLQKQYPNEDNLLTETVQTHTSLNTDLNNTSTNLNTGSNNTNTSEVDQLISKFGLRDETTEDWDKKTLSNIEKHKDEMLTKPLCSPRKVKLEVISPRRTLQESDNDQANIKNEFPNVHGISNFQRAGSERISSLLKPTYSSKIPVRRTESVKFQQSAEALKIFLKKRYPSQEDVFGEDQQGSSPDTSRDMQDKSEIERLVFKFGLGSQSVTDWDKKTKAKIDEHRDKMTPSSYISRQMDPKQIGCPTPIDSPLTSPTDEENISFIVHQNNKMTHDNIYSHDMSPDTHDLNALSKLVTENKTNNLTLNSSNNATLEHEYEEEHSFTCLQEIGGETFVVNEDLKSFIDVGSDTSGVSLSSPIDHKEGDSKYYVDTKRSARGHEGQNFGDKTVSIDQNRWAIDDEFDYKLEDMNKNEFDFEKRFDLLTDESMEFTMTEIPVEHKTDTSTESIDTEFSCTFRHQNQHNVTDDISRPDPSTLHSNIPCSSQIIQHVALQETVEIELSHICHQDTCHNLTFRNTEMEQDNNVMINRPDLEIVSQQQDETNKEDTYSFVSPSHEKQELSYTTNETVETVIPKRTPPRKPPRKKKSNPDVGSIPSILKHTNIHDYLNSSIPCFVDVTNTREGKSCITYDHDLSHHDLSHKTEIDPGRITNVPTSSTDPGDSSTDTIKFNSPNIDDNIDTKQINATNLDDDYLEQVPFICNMPVRRQRIANSELRDDHGTTNTEERKPSPCSGGVCCHNDVTQCKLCSMNGASGVIQENIKEEFVPVKQGNDIDVITDSNTNDREPSMTNFQTSVTEIDKSGDEAVLSTKDNKDSTNDDTSGYLDPENLKTDNGIPPLDEALKNTEQELCQTYLVLMDTWLAKRANRKTGETFVSDVDDWQNVKSKLKIGTFLSNSEESSSNNSEDSSVEGVYIVETSLEDENEVMGQQRGLTSNIKHTFGLPKYDENGDEIIDNLPSINEDDIENTIENTEFCQNYEAFHEPVINSDDIFNNNEDNSVESNENGEECTDYLNSALKLDLDFLKVEDEEEIDDYGQTSLLEVTNKRDLSLESSNLGKVNKHIEDHNNTNSEHKPKRFVTFDANSADDSEVIHACHTPGSECNVVDHVTTGKTLTPLIPHQKNTEEGVFSTVVDVHCEDFNLNSTNSVTDSVSKIAIIQELNTSTMPEKSSGNTKTSQMSEYKGGKKITTKTTTSVNNDGYDEDQTEQKRNLAHLSETIAKLNGENTDDIIPEINQSITKLNGGNLVITTLTHRVVEEEDEDKGERALVPVESSSNKNSYIVRDHKGDTYMIEDITDVTHESPYFSSSEHKYNSEYESMSNGSGSPQYQKIHNLKAHGNSGVDYNTAEEVILSLYNPNSMEYTETDERHYSGQYSDERHKRGHGQLQPYGYSDSSTNKQTTSYEYEDGGYPQSHPYGSSSSKTIKQSYEMSSDGPWVTDGKNSYAGSKDVNMKKEVTNQSSAYDRSGMNAMSAAYMVEANASIPQINPYFVQQPLIIPQPPLPQYSLLQLEPLPKKVTTGVQVTTEPVRQIEEHKIVTGPDETDSKRIQERPVYKSVALVKGPYESPKWHTAKKHKPYEVPEDEVDSGRKYKIVKSSASDDVKEETMEYSESTKTYTTMKTENVDTSGGRYLHDNRNVSTIDVDRNRNRPITMNGNGEFIEPRYVTEKTINVGKPSSDGRQYRSMVEVNGNSCSGNKPRSYDQLDGYQSRVDSILNHQQNYHETPEPERKHYTDVDRDMKVIRGNILIKNNFDDGLDEFNDNINVFDHGFSMNKQNPLYNSDEDINKSYEEENKRQQERNMRDMENMAFETVDRFSKTKNGKCIALICIIAYALYNDIFRQF